MVGLDLELKHHAFIIAMENEQYTIKNQFNSYSYLTLVFLKIKNMAVKEGQRAVHWLRWIVTRKISVIISP